MSVIKKLLYGMGLAALAYMIMPDKMKKKVEPMVSKRMDEAKMLAEKGKNMLKKNFNEKKEDVMDKICGDEAPEKEEVDLKKEIEELKATVKALQNEIKDSRIY